MTGFLKGRKFLEALGLNPSESHFESELLAILKIVFGFGGNTEVVVENFSYEERESIRQYIDMIQLDLNQRTVFSDVATMGPDDGSGIPKGSSQLRIERSADLRSDSGRVR